MRQLVLLLIFTMVTTGCFKGFEAPFNEITRIASGSIGEILPATDKVDPNCATSIDYDTCIFLKNPVYQAGRGFTGLTKSQLDPFQTLGVKLIGLNDSGFLENADFRISTDKSTRLAVGPGSQLKFVYSTASGTQVEQLMAYYFYRLALDYWGSKGTLALRNRNLNVIVDSAMGGFERRTNTIHLLKNTKSWPMALDASQSVYLLGTANVHYATAGRINELASNDSNHKMCGADVKGCCTANSGCSRALISGISTYFAASLFPGRPVIGEMSANRLNGVRLCSAIDRDLRNATSLTRTSAFSACGDRNGDVHIMGTLYASIFWQVKQALPLEAVGVDRVYLEHLSGLTGADTFLTARDKLLSMSPTILTGTIRTALVDEFTRRGF